MRWCSSELLTMSKFEPFSSSQDGFPDLTETSGCNTSPRLHWQSWLRIWWLLKNSKQSSIRKFKLNISAHFPHCSVDELCFSVTIWLHCDCPEPGPWEDSWANDPESRSYREILWQHSLKWPLGYVIAQLGIYVWTCNYTWLLVPFERPRVERYAGASYHQRDKTPCFKHIRGPIWWGLSVFCNIKVTVRKLLHCSPICISL